MDAPQNVSELRSLMKSINYLSRFIPNLATKAKPLNDLLSEKNLFRCGDPQEAAFRILKEDMSKPPVLAWYSPSAETVITSDASSYGVGAVLKQKQSNETYRPIAYASKTLSPAQKNWAQIEKEGYAVVWACERFKDFITGIPVRLETDHKPLVPIFTKKPLDDLTPKLQRMKLRLMRYAYSMQHVPGKEVGAADILSRRPMPYVKDDDDLEEEVQSFVAAITAALPASEKRLTEIIHAQQEDPTCQLLIKYSQQGWPERRDTPESVATYWSCRSDIALENGILLRGSRRIIIPAGPLRQSVLEEIHRGHLGIIKCQRRAREAIWWPGMATELEMLVKKCPVCIEERKNPHEPLLPTPFPERPWHKIAADLFKLETKWYIVVTDYYSRYPEVALLQDLREETVIERLKSIFARHGTPDEFFTDNGTHFGPLLKSRFQTFAKEWGFVHTTSSPKFAQSNGEAEAAVKIVKKILKKGKDDPHRALQNYRATPLDNGFSPAQLLMGRRLRTALPISSAFLKPCLPDEDQLCEKEEARIESQKRNYDRGHRTRDLSELQPGEEVWIVDLQRPGVILAREAPRSYIVETDKRNVRRNRYHLIPREKEDNR